MEINRQLLAPCGLYCGVCSIMIAHRDRNEKFKQVLADLYGLKPEQIHCEGCLSDDVCEFCQVCKIKACAAQREIEGCHQCDEFPCEHIENFPIEEGRKVMLRSVPQRRELGTEAWVAAEIARYSCPQCGAALFRGAQRCRNCKQECR